MVSLVKSALFAAVLFTLICFIECNVSEDVSEEDPIKQALLLIQLIRRAGAALQENSLFKHEPAEAPRSPDAPVSPLGVSDISHTNTGQSQQMYRRRMSAVNSVRNQPISPQEQQPGIYRRNLKHEESSLPTNVTGERSDFSTLTTISNDQLTLNKTYDEETTKTTKADAIKTSAPTLTVTASKSVTYKTNIARVNINKAATRKTPRRTQKITSNQIQSPIRGKQKRFAKSTTEAQEKSLIMSQVATELEKEMEQMSAQDKSDAANAYNRLSKHKLIARLRQTKTPTTLRVHLGSSTRYPIPFPVNHALCYTDPENGLCKTPL